ncbi:MAG: hypothetical protein KatS3mg031_2270 [Chitinophagales bacterium]|nr:MAG: hypothetical protein KatS3mg031_2270 [Chitinophagales bacterium]
MIKRRQFLKTTSMALVGAAAAPYILPSGRLFAKTGSQMAAHVVYVLFAGGVRQQESVLQRYLADSQGLPYEGNIMLNVLDGEQPGPNEKRVYGTDPPPPGTPGSIPIPRILSTPLQKQGTLFREVFFSKSGTGHYNGLSTVLSGYYGTAGLRNRPVHPTIFEYVRRHLGLPATKVWFVGNGIGNSTQLLNYSDHPDYGARYGANFIAPSVIFGDLGQLHLSNAKVYHPEEQLTPMYEMKSFLDQAFQARPGILPGVHNTEEEKHSIKEFLRTMFLKKSAGQIAFPPVHDTIELQITGYACEVIRWFKPTLTVINYNSIDSCHSNFTSYLRAIHRVDHAVGHLWNFIQTQVPEMAGKTALVLTPEHGRSLAPNPILDENNWRAFDHNSDYNARRMFSLLVGPGIDANLVIGSETNPVGDATDCVPTIADILGINRSDVLYNGLLDSDARSLFDRM